MKITTYNPANNKKLKEYTLHSDNDANKIILNAHSRFLDWRKTTFAHRSDLMEKAAKVLEKNKAVYAKTMIEEMGKVYSDAIAEVEKCAWVCRYYANNAEKFLKNEPVETDASNSYVAFEPIGLVLAVMPWNYPFWQVFRFAAPALMAGNVGLLKHASNVPGCALHIEEVFREAGFPDHCFTSLLIKSSQVSNIIDNKYIKAATLTGSEPAGRSVAQQSSQQLKKTVLELGGSDPYIILEDADLELSAEVCKTSRLLNTGQSCIGAKRFIVVEEVYEEFLSLFTKKMKEATMSNPDDPNADYGPMARKDLRDELHLQVMESKMKGAKILLGGEIPNIEGAYYPATIIVNIHPGMPAYHEELFGPVAAVFKVKDELEAIELANDTNFGLGGAVFTKNLKRGERIAREELECGCCFVNSFVKSDPRLPFGGIKNSGYGRELSHYGIKEFVNIKTVYIA